jgi:hypothetical protein
MMRFPPLLKRLRMGRRGRTPLTARSGGGGTQQRRRRQLEEGSSDDDGDDDWEEEEEGGSSHEVNARTSTWRRTGIDEE